MRDCLGAVLIALLLCRGISSGQIQQARPMNIRTALDTGSVQMTLTPSCGADSTSLFDGDVLSELMLPGTRSLSVTLEFDNDVAIEKSTVHLGNAGQWKLEGALTSVDLDRRRVSYRLLGDWTPFSPGAWSQIAFPSRMVRCVRMTVRQWTDTVLHFGEWTLEEGVTITRLVVAPCPVRLQPGARMRLDTRSVDDRGRLYRTRNAHSLEWSVKDTSVASIDPAGVILGKSLGNTTVSVLTRELSQAGSARVTVEPDVRPVRAAPLTINVALVVQDPLLPSGRHLHQELKWRDPRVLAGALVRHFREPTDSVVSFRLVETIEADRLFTRMRDSTLTFDRFVELLREPKWKTLREASDSGKIAFDYRAFVRYYGFDERRNKGEIDEVWVFAAPFLGMYESQLLGPRSFWWNSPPIKDGTSLTKLLSVMGLNYERGVDLALHSFGHRIESAVIQAYQHAANRPWNNRSPDPTAWDLFTRIEKDCPGGSHVGNIHFPPNGAHDYDYKNESRVVSFAQNWVRYPYLYCDSSEVNVSTWIHPVKDPLAETREHLGYLRWWFGRLPRYAGVTAGVLNNWWHYVLDYESADALARRTASGLCP